jgi:aminoglycoside phosphotransferase (APT) family kinase protein
MPEPLGTPEAEALRTIGERLGIDIRNARPLRVHDARTILLPHEGLVIRLTTASDEAHDRALKATRLTSWLATQDFPTVLPAASGPLLLDGYIATAWRAVSGTNGGALKAHQVLGRLLRALHSLPTVPFALPIADPLARLRSALRVDADRTTPVLDADSHDYLDHQIHQLDAAYRALRFPLGVGLIHNDAHPGNLLPDAGSPYGYVLTDWESACTGPREMDLILTGAPGSRFGDTEAERIAFVSGYDYDIAAWPGYTILRDIRDLHSLASHIRAAPHHPGSLAELHARVSSLREDDRTIRWRAV